MPAGYSFKPPQNDVASAVLSKSTWAVLGLTLDIELFSQSHYRSSIEPDANLSELWKDVFLFHWKEASQHAIVDELEWRQEHERLTEMERDQGVTELIELVAAVDDIADHRPVQEVVTVADSIRAQLAKGQEHSAAQRFVDFWSGAGAWESMPNGKQTSIAARIHTVLQHFDALFREQLQRAHLARLHMPMLFMTGAQTLAVTRRIAELLRLTLPGAQHEVLPAMVIWDRSLMRRRSTGG